MSKKENLNETIDTINEKNSETSETLLEKDKAPDENPKADNNCYTDFSSAGCEIVTQDFKNCQGVRLSVFEKLSKVNVNDKIEYKNKMKYLSWADAWGETKKLYPNMTSKVYETESGMNYFTDGRTCFVKVGVTIEGLEHIEYYPVTDYRNVSIPLTKVTSFDVNTAIQRGLTKAIARHGLGLYIYAGEDLPEEIREIINDLYLEIEKYGPQSEKLKKGILEKYKVKSLNELTENQAKEAIDKLRNFNKKSEENANANS